MPPTSSGEQVRSPATHKDPDQTGCAFSVCPPLHDAVSYYRSRSRTCRRIRPHPSKHRRVPFHAGLKEAAGLFQPGKTISQDHPCGIASDPVVL